MRRRYSIILPLEGLAGSHVEDIAREMIATAKRFDMPVSLAMNGTRLLAFPNSTMAEMREDYETQLTLGEEREASEQSKREGQGRG